MSNNTYQVIWEQEAEDQLLKLHPTIATDIVRKVHTYLILNPRGGEQLSGKFKGLRKLKLARYRILYYIIEPKKTIVITNVGSRSDIYD